MKDHGFLSEIKALKSKQVLQTVSKLQTEMRDHVRKGLLNKDGMNILPEEILPNRTASKMTQGHPKRTREQMLLKLVIIACIEERRIIRSFSKCNGRRSSSQTFEFLMTHLTVQSVSLPKERMFSGVLKSIQ